MRFSGKLHLNRYFFVILPIISCMLFGYVLSIIGSDQFEFDFMVFGQSPNEKKINDENSPNTVIISATDGNNNLISNNGSTASNSMKFAFSGTDNQGVTISHFECSIDGQAFVTCLSTNTINVADGTHTFRVRSEDKDRIKDLTPASFRWTVDATPPATSINSAIDGNNNTISSNGNSQSTSMKFIFSGTDTGGVGVDHFECNIDNSKFVTCTSPFIFPNLLKDGSHTFKVLSEDNAGNKDLTPA